MQVAVFTANVRQAVKQEGVKPETPEKIYKIVLQGNTDKDFDDLEELLEWLKDKGRRDGVEIVEETVDDLAAKVKAAKSN